MEAVLIAPTPVAPSEPRFPEPEPAPAPEAVTPRAAAAPEVTPPRAAAAPTSAPAPSPAPPPSLLEQLVRNPAAFVDRVDDRDLPARVRTMIALVVVCAGVFGGVVGSFRGGRQIAYAGIKVPLLLLGTLVVCAPAFIGIARAAGAKLSARAIIGLTLGACTRFALVLAGLAPVVWLAEGGSGYHALILVIVVACAVAGLAAGGLLFRGLARSGRGGVVAGLAFVAVYAIVGGQVSWMLRPFVVRPRTVDVPFVRAREGDLLDSVRRSTRSSMGIYDDACEEGPCD